MASETLMSMFCCAPAARGSTPRPAGRYLAITTSSSSSSSSSPSLAARSCTLQPPRLLTSSSTPPPFHASSMNILRLPTASDLTSLQMPSLHCTFPALVHPDYDLVKETCDAWIEAVAEPPSATASRFLHDCLLPLLVCRFIPTSISRARLVHVIKAIAWLMIADDEDDHPDVLGSDYASTAHRAGLVMAILHGKLLAVDGAGDERSFELEYCSFLARPGFASKSAHRLKALAELWHQIRKEMPPSLQARFVSTMADYFEGLKVQASFRKEVMIPNVESYMEIRRQASFLFPCFILMEYALGIELDETTFYNPLIQEHRKVVLDHINLCNDIVSCPIEICMGDYFNLPFILYNSRASTWRFTSFQNAMDHVAQMAQDLNNRAIFLISAIHEESKTCEPYMVPLIHAYVEGLSLCMSGALAWFYETSRYQQQASGRSELLQIAVKEMATQT